MNYSRRLAEFVSSISYSALPADIRHESKRATVNYIAVALGGVRNPTVCSLLDLCAGFSGSADATVIGSAVRLDPLSAAFMNAVSANVLDFDDTHMPTIMHPTAIVAPGLFALAESSQMGGTAFIEAFVAGVETGCRLGASVSPSHYTRGWHITATCGIFGAAVACAKVLRLSVEQTANALGIAASLSSGLVESLSNGAKNVQIGNAARNGMISALAAQKGLTAAETAIEGPSGWGAASGVMPDPEILFDRLGDRWELRNNTYKASPCAIVLAPVIDAALMLREMHGVSGEAVAELTVRGNPLLLLRADRPVVPDEGTARISIQHGVAAALHYGAAGIEEFSETVVHRPEIAALRSRVRAVADPNVAVDEVYVSARLKDDRVTDVHVPHARGGLARPLSDDELSLKLRGLLRFGAPSLDGRALLEAAWSLERLDDVAAIMAMLRPCQPL